jgi:hypothetical protein
MSQTLRRVANVGAAIPVGAAVSFDGPYTQGSDLFKVVKADPAVSAKMPAVGVAVWGIPAGNNGMQIGVIVTSGDTGSRFGLMTTTGQKIYVGSDGMLSTTPPSSGIVQQVAVGGNPYLDVVIDVDEVGDTGQGA